MQRTREALDPAWEDIMDWLESGIEILTEGVDQSFQLLCLEIQSKSLLSFENTHFLMFRSNIPHLYRASASCTPRAAKHHCQHGT